MLKRVQRGSVMMVGGEDGAIRFAFTERTGGVSQPPFSSLNLGSHVGDDPSAVAENRRRVLAALDAEPFLGRLLVPNQVHGDRVATITSSDSDEIDDVRACIAEGADAIVCTAPDVPVMLCFADCVPVVLTCPRGFAVAHSGWKGTYAGIAGKTARVLAERAGCSLSDMRAYIGPHILGDEYEVSDELLRMFSERFGSIEARPDRLLDLSSAIMESLVGAGVERPSITDPALSTVRDNDRFFSYRKEHGSCGRHAAVAIMGAA